MKLRRFIRAFSFANNTGKKSTRSKNYTFLADQDDVVTETMVDHPLRVACSGGGGHNTAMIAITQYLQQKGVSLTSHSAKLYRRIKNDTLQAQKISWGIYLLSKGIAAYLTKLTFLPQLPTQKEIIEEIKILNEQQNSLTKNKNQEPARDYIDMMLDIYPTGYLNVAIWNILQRKDRVEDLKKIIAFQMDSDDDNYYFVKKYFLKELEEAHLFLNNKKPYTEIICTQAMALPALCDAVFEHNAKYHTNIKIKQYITDIASIGAIHFFKPLAKLTTTQRQQIKLYGVGLKSYLFNNHQLIGFDEYVDIHPAKNPMVRKGFCDYEKFSRISFNEKTQLNIKENGKLTPIKIDANQKVAAIMLGSQAGKDTVSYVKSLMYTHDKVFIFGGQRKEIKLEIQQILNTVSKDIRNQLSEKFVLLENQDDSEMGSIMYRSNTIVTRGGGLSVMELMAVHTHFPPELGSQKSIFVHHKETGKINLSSGIEWEDRNAETLIEYAKARGIHALKTSTERFSHQLKGERALRQEFYRDLNNYIDDQFRKDKNKKYFSKETIIHLFSFFGSHTHITKARAAFKMRLAMTKNQNFSAAEISALENSDLHAIIEHYEKLNILPACFLAARESFRQKRVVSFQANR